MLGDGHMVAVLFENVVDRLPASARDPGAVHENDVVNGTCGRVDCSECDREQCHGRGQQACFQEIHDVLLVLVMVPVEGCRYLDGCTLRRLNVLAVARSRAIVSTERRCSHGTE